MTTSKSKAILDQLATAGTFFLNLQRRRSVFSGAISSSWWPTHASCC